MESNILNSDNYDKIIDFIDSTNKLGEQLKSAAAQQKLLLTRMVELKNENKTDSSEYRELAVRSQDLQNNINRFKPIWEKNMNMLKAVKNRKKP
jgi:uncharacterized protein YlxW (UPF0749 family)